MVQEHLTSTVAEIVMQYKNMPVVGGDPDLLGSNQCWPQALAPQAEPGYALLAGDRYYAGQAFYPLMYAAIPAPAVTRLFPP